MRVTPLVTAIVTVLALAAALFAAWHTWRGYTFSNPLFYALAAVEAVLVAVTVGGLVALNVSSRHVNGVLFVSYLVTCLVIPPAALLWGISEKSRWGTGVVAIALFTVAILAIRLQQIWSTGV